MYACSCTCRFFFLSLAIFAGMPSQIFPFFPHHLYNVNESHMSILPSPPLPFTTPLLPPPSLCIPLPHCVFPPSSGNAILNAETPVMDELSRGEYLTLDASGLSVGLPEGLMGNSEVGHFTIGTGRVVYQVSLFWSIQNETKSHLCFTPLLSTFLLTSGTPGHCRY